MNAKNIELEVYLNCNNKVCFVDPFTNLQFVIHVQVCKEVYTCNSFLCLFIFSVVTELP